MNITPDMKMADVLFRNITLLPVIDRFNIKLGFGEKSVKEICSLNGVNLDFFLEITNSFIDEEYFPVVELNSFPVALMVNYLKKTHSYYLEEKVPELSKNISALIESERPDNSQFKLIGEFFSGYRNELENHINREENIVYPYILEIESAYTKNIISNDLYSRIKKYSINDFATEHDDVEEKLYDLKNLMIRYLPPPSKSGICNNILIELFRLEKDLTIHAGLEDKVLVPKVSAMEEYLLSLKKS
jgi:regulator of cell morphogenesis and NO signaling